MTTHCGYERALNWILLPLAGVCSQTENLRHNKHTRGNFEAQVKSENNSTNWLQEERKVLRSCNNSGQNKH
jgi:CRISPR/Cas system CMR-associated protein Cmr5 small subunit